MAKELEQPQQRRPAVFADQHGRDWRTIIDIRTGHAAAPFEPDFTAPWYPDTIYVEHDPADARKVRIAYGKILSHFRDAHDAYEDLRFRVAEEMWGSAFITKMGETYEDDDPQLRKKIGSPPSEIAYPEAALEGNRWVLGFTDKVPPFFVPILEKQRRTLGGRKYLDADEAATLDETFDPDASGGKKAKVGRPKKVAA